MGDTAIFSIVISSTGVLITLVLGLLSRSIANDKMRKELFAEFNERYKKLNDDLYELKDKELSLEELEADPLHQIVMDFFNLCAEEYYWKKRLGKRIWLCWHGGMRYWYTSVPVLQEAWQKEMKQVGKKGYYLNDGEDFFS